MTDLIDDWYTVAEKAMLEGVDDIFQRIARACGLDEYERPEPQRYRLYNGNEPIRCRLCDENAWVDEDGIFVCEHPEYQLPIRALDRKLLSEVSRFERIE